MEDFEAVCSSLRPANLFNAPTFLPFLSPPLSMEKVPPISKISSLVQESCKTEQWPTRPGSEGFRFVAKSSERMAETALTGDCSLEHGAKQVQSTETLFWQRRCQEESNFLTRVSTLK